MLMEIFGSFDRNKLFCAGSVTKFLTTFTVLSLLSEKFNLNQILDDDNFLDDIATNDSAKKFLKLFQKMIGSQFTLRDLCTYYTGLPYTFEPTEEALEQVETGKPFKHHSVLEEKEFLSLCEKNISPLYPNRSKFHYSELSILFLGYFIEQVYNIKMEILYQKYVMEKFKLKHSLLSRTKPDGVHVQELSDKYDYAAVAIQDHGFFCYSNGFYTTLNDMQLLLSDINEQPVFQQMIDITHARAAADNLMNGLTIELRVAGQDIIYGYEGLSFSCCFIFASSKILKRGYLTVCDDETKAYQFIYDKFGYHTFDQVPRRSAALWFSFIKRYPTIMETQSVPIEYQGNYRRVKINDIELTNITVLGNNFLQIRDPDDTTYDLVYRNKGYYIKDSYQIHDSKIGLYQTKNRNRYMFYNGSLYKRLSTVLSMEATAQESKESEFTLSKLPKLL